MKSGGINDAAKKKLELIEKAKEFGKILYSLKETHSYEYYVSLPRKALGWNLTAAPALELKAKEFSFPFVGTFGYLGFFDEKMKDEWKNKFISRGFDVYENEIGAYSTLGYFSDPVFSTYLEFSDAQLVRLVLHEMAHEKIYFNSDTDFSESLAVYIEKIATNLYFYHNINTPPDQNQLHLYFIREYGLFQDFLDEARKNLENIYSSDFPDKIKLQKKKEEFEKLRAKIKNAGFKFLKYAAGDTDLNEFNNAFLVQNQRYTPSRKKTGFSLLLDDCHNDIVCWFDGLKKLKACDNKTRKIFMETEVHLNEVLNKCR